MESLLNTAPCGFISFADDGRILAANETLAGILGFHCNSIVGRVLASLLSPGGAVFYHTFLFPLLKMHGRAEEVYLSLRAADGQEVPMLLNAVRREQNGVFASDCILLRVQQRSRWEEAVSKARRAAEEAQKESAQKAKELETAKVQIEKTLEELRNSHWHLRKLSEVLPMCMECGKVRSDESRWMEVSDFLRSNSLMVSHGCCPECEHILMRKLGLGMA